SASGQHTCPHRRHILQLHVARLAHPVPYNFFSTKFYRKTLKDPHSMFALVEWQNREVWLVSPIHSRAIVPQHLVRPLSIFLYQGPRSRFSPRPYTCYSSVVPGSSMLPKSILSSQLFACENSK